MASRSRLISSSSACITHAGGGELHAPVVDVDAAVALLGDEPVRGGGVAEAAVGRDPVVLRSCAVPSPIWSNHRSWAFCRKRDQRLLDRTAARSRSGRSCSGSTTRPRSALRPARSTRACRAWPGSGTRGRARTSAGRCPAVGDTRRRPRRDRTGPRTPRPPRRGARAAEPCRQQRAARCPRGRSGLIDANMTPSDSWCGELGCP